MKNIIQAIKYFFNNFIVLSLFALPSAVFFAIKYNSSSFVDYLLNLESIGQKSLINIYLHFSLLPSFNVLIIILWALVLICSLSLLFSYIDRHMKYGIKSFFKAFTSLNYIIFAVLPAAFVIFCLNELFSFLLALLINLFRLSPSEVISIILPIIYLLVNILMLTIMSVIAMWVPIKIVTGYSNKDSLRYSIRLSQGRQFKLMFGLAFPLLIMAPVMMVIKNFSYLSAVNTAAYVIFYIFMIGYFVSYFMVSYFDYTCTLRKDIKEKIF